MSMLGSDNAIQIDLIEREINLTGPVVAVSKHGKHSASFMKGGEFIGYLLACQLIVLHGVTLCSLELHRVYTMTSTYFIVQGVYNETP
jgi:hypothetical protein